MRCDETLVAHISNPLINTNIKSFQEIKLRKKNINMIILKRLKGKYNKVLY